MSQRARTRRILALTLSACMLLALGCGLLGVAVQQRVITLADINIRLGPLIVVTRGPRSFQCPRQNNPTTNLCDRLSAAPRPAVYRVWIFWYRPRPGVDSTLTLAQWTVPVRQ